MLLYSYFMAKRITVKLLSRGSGEDLGNCCQRPKTEGKSFPDLLNYRGTMIWLFPKLFYYLIVLNDQHTVNSTPMLVVNVGTFDVP